MLDGEGDAAGLESLETWGAVDEWISVAAARHVLLEGAVVG